MKLQRVDQLDYDVTEIYLKNNWPRVLYLNKYSILLRLKNYPMFSNVHYGSHWFDCEFENIRIVVAFNLDNMYCRVFSHTVPIVINTTSVLRASDLLNRYIFNPEYYKLFLFFQANKVNRDVLSIIKDFLCFYCFKLRAP
jgi:hypothetical protein